MASKYGFNWRGRLKVLATSQHLGGDIRAALAYMDELEKERDHYRRQFEARQIRNADVTPDGGIDELGPI